MTSSTQYFQSTVTDHQLTVNVDAGLHRHLSFRKADGDPEQHFDIITYPHHLLISGDMGSFLFSRNKDMFNFFEGTEETFKGDSWFSYGHAKMNLISDSCQFPSEFFDEDIIREYVTKTSALYIDDIQKHWDALSRSNQESFSGVDDFKEKFEDEIEVFLDRTFEENEWKTDLACFNSDVITDFSFNDHDLYELKPYSLSSHFYWCVNAIVWAISQYRKIEAK